MEDKIMCLVGICMCILMLSFSGIIIAAIIKGQQPTQKIEMELK